MGTTIVSSIWLEAKMRKIPKQNLKNGRLLIKIHGENSMTMKLNSTVLEN
jgi:hypothetical protein